MRLATVIVLLWVAVANSASKRTPNFIVQAAEQKDADEFAQLAESYRKSLAMTWLGKEMPTWREPCRLIVQIEASGAGGSTSFDFGNYIFQEMEIKGERERLKNAVLPHEITHTVFAHHFRRPMPRWADEGGAVYSEDQIERDRHHKLCIKLLNDGRGIQLGALFRMTEYPKDVMCLYAQGYSVTSYLVGLKGRTVFLNFVSSGIGQGWDTACKAHYNINSVNDLEREWINHLRGLTFKH